MIEEFQGKYRWLSNFWYVPGGVYYEGLRYPTVENAYQAAKTTDSVLREEFVDVTPGQAKRLGRMMTLRANWEELKVDLMKLLVERKFMEPVLQRKLLETGSEELQEGNRWGDTFWGVCNGEGENMLGRILMDTRNKLRFIVEKG